MSDLPATTSNSWRWRPPAVILILTIIGLGTLLRFVALGQTPAWYTDEGFYLNSAWSVAHGQLTVGGIKDWTFVSPFSTTPPLYHAVLSNFVRTITKHGVTQGIFIEGGLTRDGAFLKPKLGMLDYIVTAKRDPDFTAPLFIIPTAINYDRVLEDRNLTEELLGKEDRSTRLEKLGTTFEFLFKNLFRSLVRRFKRYGYAIVTFGTPISVDDFVARHPAVLSTAFEERKAALTRFAEHVMDGISSAMPVTPVTVVARILADSEPLSEQRIVEEIARYQAEWQHRVWLTREKTPAEIWQRARGILELRRLLSAEGDSWSWSREERMLRDYYANSLLPFQDVKRRGWPERAAGETARRPLAVPV